MGEPEGAQLGAQVLADGGAKFVAPGPESFNYPDIFPGVTKPILQVFIALVVIAVFYVRVARGLKLVPDKLQFVAEYLYDFVRNGIGREQIASKDLRPYLPFLFSLFTFILLNDLFGFIPLFQLPTTAHIAFPFGLMLLSYGTFIVAGIRRHGFLHYFGKTLFPPEVPKMVLPLYTPIEFISTFVFRPLTLTVRLFATMFAGHMMLLVFILGGEYLLIHGSIGLQLASPVAFALAIALSFLELLIQVLQAFVFTVLTANYIGGALAEGH